MKSWHAPCALAAAVVWACAVQAQPAIPLVQLTSEPPLMTKAKPTLTLLLSVEHPTLGAAYIKNQQSPTDDDTYQVTRLYIGFFDPEGCYGYDKANKHFVRSGAATAHKCNGTGFSGNFMNWATMSAIDIPRLGLTGGDRVVDTESKTVLQRAMLPTRMFNSEYFPAKHLSATLVRDALPSTLLGGYTGIVHVANCLNRIHFGTERVGNCDAPGNNSNLRGSLTSDPYFMARVQVCDSADAAARPALCAAQPSGLYKPVGHLQRYSDRVRVAVFGYLNEFGNQRYGGVMRSPMKFVGPQDFDKNFKLLNTVNPVREWDARTGVFIENPHNASEGLSGAINYTNRFGRTRAASVGQYKEFDPSSELYYEALRYLQGLTPTPQAVNNLTEPGRDGFPVHTTWTDPHPPIDGHPANVKGAYSCVMNHILSIGDVRTNADRSLPGSNSTAFLDFSRPARPNSNEPNFVDWTRILGGFETNTSMSYVDGDGVTRTTRNPGSQNLANQNLETKEAEFCRPCGGSYLMAGAAYWARTHDIRAMGLSDYAADKARPGMRVRTYTIDVNERGEQTQEVHFKQNPFYLAAKYGGFIDRSGIGNPFLGRDGTTLDDTNWSRPASNAADGKVAKTYFQGSNAAEMMAALDTIFAEVLNQGVNIGQAAVSSTRLTTEGAIYQGTFDAGTWDGDLMRQRLTLNSAGNVVISASEDAATVHASAVLDRTDPATRRIFVGKTTPGLSGAATEFTWAALDADHKEALRRPPSQTPLDSEAVGQQRLQYLRGDRSLESNGTLRVRGGRLGDIVNSGAVYVNKPANVLGDAAYSAFVEANKGRPPTVFVGANDGMLHAFHGETMAELFAYVPGFLVKSLRELTLPGYIHRSYVDATPAVAEALVGNAWKTVLVGGAGAGGQGVFALDVSNPASFGAGKVLWEFTDRNDPALGNVIGRPRILKLRTSASGAPSVYKYYAVVPAGVNNHAADGAFSTTGQAAIFLLDLAKPPTSPWQAGSNYFRIELPSRDATLPNGVVGLSAVSGAAGELKFLYAGDLQGQLWKLDFGAVGSTQWTAAGLSAFKSGTTPLPLFKATDAAGAPQPITMEPEIAFGPARGHIVIFGTGKLLEAADASRPYKAQTFYAIYDNGRAAVPGRSHLRQAGIPSAGVVETGTFTWGMPANPATQASVRAGWYLDFPGVTQGERQIDGVTLQSGMVVFGTAQPPEHGCGDGAGNLYVVDLGTGDGRMTASSVGLQGQPLLLKLGTDVLTDSRSDGRANQQTRYQILTQGSAGTKASDLVPNIPDQSILQRSWRQVFNYEEMKRLP